MYVPSQFTKYVESNYHDPNFEGISIELDPPPKDNSNYTRMELEEIQSAIHEGKLPKSILNVANLDPLQLFYSLAKKKGIDPLEEGAKHIAEDLTKLSFELKFKFKRRRPYEVKKEHDVEFAHHKTDTSESPSYPSGHAMLGYGVAEFYKSNYPEMADEWDNIADIIAHSRVQMGVHYPSDVKASKEVIRQVLADGVKLAEWEKWASAARFAQRAIIKAGGKVNLSAPRGARAAKGTRGTFKRVTKPVSTPVSTPPKTMVPGAPSANSTQGWWDKTKGFATKNPYQAAGIGAGVGGVGIYGATQLNRPAQIKAASLQSALLEGSLSLEKLLSKAKLTPLAESLGNLRTRKVLENAIMDNIELANRTGRFGQMPRIPIPKKFLSPKDLYRAGFVDSYVAVPELGQTSWRTFRHPLHNLHLHEHADLLNMHVDSFPSMAMTSVKNSLSKKELRRLIDLAPSGVPLNSLPRHGRTRSFKNKISDTLSGLRHVVTEGIPGFINYEAKSLNPYREMGMVEEILSKIPKSYLADEYGYSRVKTSAEKLRLYHGSPENLDALEPRQPNKGRWGEPGIYGTTNPLVAALYAIARNDSKGPWGVLLDGRLIANSKKELNPEGYVYEYDSDDYIPPPEDDLGIGYATQSSPEILSKEKVYLDNLQDKITRVDDKDKFLEYFKKTSADQPLLRHRSTLLIRDPETGKLLAGKEPPNSKASPFFFPGGGLYDDEYDTPRNPTEEEIIEGARREALEELGIHLENPRVVGSIGQELEDWWKAKVLKNRGVPYVGGHEHYVLADKGKEDRSLYNVEGDAFEQGDYYDPAEIVEALSRAAKSDSTFAPFNREQVRAIKDNLLSKRANVTESKDSRRRLVRNKFAGLESQESIYARLAPLLPEGVHHVSGGLPDARGTSDVDIFYPTDEHSDLLSKMPKGTFVANSKPDKTIYSIPGYDREVNLFATLDPMKQESILHRATMMELAAKYPELERMAYKLKASGLGSEPAWAKVLGVKGDPYERMQHTQEMLEAAEKLSLKKTASDLSVLTAVPKQNLDLIMRKGLYSQKAMLDDPEVLSAFLAQRNADKAWKNEEQYDEKRFREQYDKRRKLIEDKGGSIEGLEGPSVFFTEPDPDKVSDPRHFINKFNTETLRVNLAKLLNDIPDTRIHGAELTPWDDEGHAADPDNYYKQVHRDITPEEVSELISRGSKDLWKDYSEESLGRYYAKDVPHAFIRTPSGIIPPEYLELVEKTSSEQPLLRHRATLLIRDPDTGKLLVADNTGDPRFTDISPFSFPGGGIYHDEYHTPRTPTEEDIIEGARREALEELGIGLANPRVVGSSEVLLPEYKQKAIKSRKAPYEGKHEHYVLADKGPADNSLYNSEGDAFTRGQYVDPKTIYESLIQFSKGLNSHAPLNAGQAKAIKEHLLSKQSSLKAQFLPEYLELVEKTSAYKDYRPRGTLYLLDGKGGVMADKPTADYDSTTPYFFPGGGIFEEEKVDRLPTRSEIVQGVEREALEELGTKLKNIRVLQDEPANVEMPDWWRERQKKKRGVDYKGIAEFFAAAERGEQDKSIYGADNDEFKGTFYPIDEVASALEANAKPGDDYYEDSMRQARLLRSLLEKTSSAKEQLKHILITGQSGSGKTTEAKRLSAELGLPVVHLDEQKGFGPKGVDPDYIEDLTKATQDIIGNLDKPHIVEGTQMLSEQFPLALLRSNDLRILEADEDELVRRLTERGWNTESGRDLKGPESADEARHVAKHQRKSVDMLVERLKKKAALEDEFQPDLTPDDLKALGVYDQVYGDAPSEASMKEWPEHWINKQDPLGWLQWYERYSGGRRTEDDARQIKRWKSFKARHLAQYLKNPTPRRAAALRNWGIDVENYR